MNWRGLVGWLNQDKMQRKITQLTVETGTLTLERDSAQLTVDRLTTTNEALADSNVHLAQVAEFEELMCEEASFWLMTLPISSADHFHKVHDWLVRCDILLHDHDGRPSE